jgi:ribonuclease P protein subunit RPR2
MKRQKKGKPSWQIGIAKERIEKLLNISKETAETKPEKSRRYVNLARKIGMRYNVRLSKYQKKQFCKTCDTILVPGKTMSVRVVGGKTVKKCSFCGNEVS